MKKRTIIWIAGIVGIVTILAFFLINKIGESGSVVWKTATVERGDIRMTISATGTLDVLNSVDVGTQISGAISEILVDYNDQVKKDQVIARLDTRRLEAVLQDAQAAVRRSQLLVQESRRAYENALKYNSGTDLAVIEAEARAAQASAQAAQAEKDYLRSKELYAAKAISTAEFEARESEYEAMVASLRTANAQVERAKATVSLGDVEKARADYLSAQAALVSTEAMSQQARVNLDFATIRAPIDGIVLARNVEVGQTVAASFQTPVLFTIAADLTAMEIAASVDEADIGFIREGQKVHFTVDAYLDEEFQGEVKQIRLQPEVVSNVVTYTVMASTTNERLLLLPGMTANLDIVVEERVAVLKVPARALTFMPPAEYVEKWKDEIAATPAGLSGGRPLLVSGEQPAERNGLLWVLDENQPVPLKVSVGISDSYFTEVAAPELREGMEVLVGVTVGGKESTEISHSPFLPSHPGEQKKEKEQE